jgi:hypothetical protein
VRLTQLSPSADLYEVEYRTRKEGDVGRGRIRRLKRRGKLPR